MDIRPPDAYLEGMLARLVTLLAALTLVFLTTLSAAHATGMSMGGSDHAVSAGMEMHPQETAGQTCQMDRPCRSADQAMCDVVCAGLTHFIVPASALLRDVFEPIGHDQGCEPIPLSQIPAGIERPPRHSFL